MAKKEVQTLKLTKEEVDALVAAAVEIPMVYLGRRYTSTEVSYVWQNLDADGALAGEERWFAKSLVTGAIVGGVYKTQQSADGRVYLSGALSPRYSHRWHSTEDVMNWQVQDRAAELSIAAARRQKSDDVNEALQAMRPIRKLYQQTNWQNQRAIEILVLDYLRR